MSESEIKLKGYHIAREFAKGETSLLCHVYSTDLFAGYVTVKHTGSSIFSPLFIVKFHSSSFSLLTSGLC